MKEGFNDILSFVCSVFASERVRKAKRGLLVLLYVVWTACGLDGTLLAQVDDTLRQSTLDEVRIAGAKAPSTLKGITPTQVIAADVIAREGYTLLSEAAQKLAGVTLKDYGGVGGIKTISARGLSSGFSTLCIDGIAVSDAQNGQIDLGRYLLGNSAFVSFANAQEDNPLQSARAYAAGNVLNMETQEPALSDSKRSKTKLGIEGGSFGYVSTTLYREQRLGNRLSASLFANYLKSDGDYPFTLYYTAERNDSSSVERRKNSQVRMLTADGNLFFHIDSRRSLNAKVHYMRGFHALPGPAVYYSAKASEHSEESLFFAQTRYKAVFDRLRLQLAAKYQHNDDLYEDTAANTASHRLHNLYRQNEGYLSGSLEYGIWRPHGKDNGDGVALRAATDAAYNGLESNLEKNNDVGRLTSESMLGLHYGGHRLTADGNLLATLVKEVRHLPPSNSSDNNSFRKLSPYLGTNILLLQHSDSAHARSVRLRYFFKEHYRIPNFSELYFFTIERHLRPEKALQHNIGLTWVEHCDMPSIEGFMEISTTIDGYYNRVSDKIIAIPTQNMFLWSMTNLGRVDIKGSDISVLCTLTAPRWSLDLTLNYAYQHAVDCSDPDGKTYLHQIPYTPRHSGNANLYLKTPWVNVGVNAMLVGERYCKQQNNPQTHMPAYADCGATIDRDFDLPAGRLKVRLQILNIFNTQYEVVRSYPMMGRNYKCSITFSF